MATSMVPHKNISRVEGLCLEESCIVYSYAPEGDLEARLARDNPDAPPLTWKDRFSLAYGEA